MEHEAWTLSSETIRLAKSAQEAAMVDNPCVSVLNDLVDEIFPMVGDRICLKDLISILGCHFATYGEEAERAAKQWWKTPHPDWGPSMTQRINAEARREWLLKPTVTMKCRTRTEKPGYRMPAQTRSLGE